jgi:hypothetical protein
VTLVSGALLDVVRDARLPSGALSAQGVTAQGQPWTYDGVGDSWVALQPEEGMSPRFQAWILSGAYSQSNDPAPASRALAACDWLPPSSASFGLRFDRPELGAPTLCFDAGLSLIAARYHGADGELVDVRYSGWVDGAPAHIEERVRDSVTMFHPRRVASPPNDVSTAPPRPRHAFTFPKSGEAHVPMRLVDQAIHFRARVGGVEVEAELDSGARSSLLDLDAPHGRELAAGRSGVFELSPVDVGELHAEHIPAIATAVGAGAALGDARATLILGATFFSATRARIDFEHRELVFGARDVSSAARVPLAYLNGHLVVSATIDDEVGRFLLDTGDTGTIDPFLSWALAHQMPGDRPTSHAVGPFGVGEPLDVHAYRVQRVALGPIALTDVLVHSEAGAPRAVIAGLIGTGLLARCAAITIDLPQRALSLEGPCDRPIAERKLGLHVGQNPEDLTKWFATVVWPGGAADRAGVRVGDRIVSVDGAAFEPTRLAALDRDVAGKRVEVDVERSGQRMHFTIVLRALLAEGR